MFVKRKPQLLPNNTDTQNPTASKIGQPKSLLSSSSNTRGVMQRFPTFTSAKLSQQLNFNNNNNAGTASQ